ncbi:gluconate kinase [Paenibacillus baekrokdamisoli]|uniref:Gluconate kinase n=1 Tax=Paenibacillus baekrokdamisoli TaxID=1712516 RepID=A0A3G9JJD0_9BACL|nr:FGGY family carbohydrate kinase [Paenibacillus baekrokdamisoli]MBB3067860.1 xylulokinase [Paenibacillus baekrokdamisoli]BBH23094.1 gluconate kinase [Paenibacillus baekrokdamisoli]
MIRADKYIASFDIGTTNVKGLLVSHGSKPILEKNKPLTTIQTDHHMEQDPSQWLEAVVTITKEWLSAGILAEDIALITFSGQMQDCIPIDLNGNPVRPAILYSDGRAAKQGNRIKQDLGISHIRDVTGNHMDGTLTFPKIVWLKEEEPDNYHQTSTVLIGSKDYVIYQLTGKLVTDPTTAATTGLMNLSQRQWETDWLNRYEIASSKLPAICPSDEVVGLVTEHAAQITGYIVGTPVLCGIGDAGAATLGAGITCLGEMYAYLGTTGWVATPTKEVSQASEGVFHLAHVDKELYIVIAPLMNAGNAHKWVMSVFGDSLRLNDDLAFEELDNLMKSCDRGKSELLFLPYLNGERCPVQNTDATGCYIGIRPTTTKEEMCCAVLEGVAMSMRQVMEFISTDVDNNRLTLIGGGSKSVIWNQIIADVFDMEVIVPQDSQYLPSMGAAALGFIHIGWEQSYFEFCQSSLSLQNSIRYVPNEKNTSHYKKKYKKYSMLYPALEPIFSID